TTTAFAKIVYSFAKSRSINVRYSSAADYAPQDLVNEDIVVFLTSTFYNGEFPDNMQAFWNYLSAPKSNQDIEALKKIRFTVFGLGNQTTKGNFCIAAKRIQTRMSDLGAFELVPSVFSDEYHPDGHEGAFKPWMKCLWIKLTGSNTKLSLPQHYIISETTTAVGTQAPADFSPLTVESNRVLTPAGYDRPVHHIVLNLPAGTTYELVDHIQIKPKNNGAQVARLIARLGLNKDQVLKLTPTDEIGLDLKLPSSITVQDLFENYVDISSPPTRSFLEGISALARADEATALESLAEDMKAGNEYSRITGGGAGREPFSLVDVLERFQSCKIGVADILGNVPLLPPRFYSICSAPSVSPNKVEICFLDDHWASSKDASKVFQGVCSGYLKSTAPGQVVQAKITRGVLSLPKDLSTPIVAVALGTGVAVFRGILQHREKILDSDSLANVSRVRLYYGARTKGELLFSEELNRFVQKGLVEVITACSHDQEEFITPANKLVEFPDKVTEVLDNGGYYLYCGLGGLIPSYHEQAVLAALQTSRGVTQEAAYGDIEVLKELGRWQVEAYSRSLDDDNHLKSLISRQMNAEKPVADEMGQGDMFCFQCGQTNLGKGCTTIGICGKTPTVAALQDLLISDLKKLGWYAYHLRSLPGATDAEKEDQEVNRFTLLATFSTLTNVNFDDKKISKFIEQAEKLTLRLKLKYAAACARVNATPEKFPLADIKNVDKVVDIEDLVAEGKKVGVLSRFKAGKNDALIGLQEMLVYGLKGLAAYTDHSLQYGNEKPEIYSFIHEAFSFLISPESKKLDAVLGMLMKCGQVNLIALELLHNSNESFGVQSPFIAPAKPKAGKCILISGHDLKILGDLLAQLEVYKTVTGIHINVFTHGEMLPAFGYPKLRESPHLAGHFGVAWQRQSIEFGHFPGPILMTSNCLTKPKDDYKDRIYTVGPVGWPEIPHIEGSDYSVLLKAATTMSGFGVNATKFTYPENAFTSLSEFYNVGWGSETVIGAAGTVLDAVKAGLITRFYVIGGCDGYEGERSYYTDLAAALPDTSVVLTVGCGKFRINHLQYGTVGDSGIPRLLDLGQCNDSYSAVQIALALANALECSVNDLPLSIVLSWFEQKAVVVLLSLLSLGIRNIRVGPTVPAFLRPSIVKVLNEQFNLMPIGADVKADIAKMVAGEK
ncbi:UNVERIFIED_CONTAM: hypothetical protein HDU68_002840, partial [Siphonaria sp. JEL0065]